MTTADQRASGEPKAGARLEVTLQPSGASRTTSRPTVLKAEPNHELRSIERSLIPGLFDVEHIFMQAMISSAAKTNIGLAVSVFGWIVMAFAVRHPGIQLALLDLGTLVAGFGLFVSGLFMMIWTER